MTVADVAIAGGGIAGSALAILLGRMGFAVELYEQARFPREKVCGEGILPGGAAVLEQLGLVEEVGGIPLRGIGYELAGRSITVDFPARPNGQGAGLAQRRLTLDAALFAAAARTPGVRARQGCRVEAALVRKGRVVGLEVDGRPRPAAWVVGADGVRSRLARQLGLATTQASRRLGLRAHFRLRRPPAEPARVRILVGQGYELYLTPLPNHELSVVALTQAVRQPWKEQFYRWLAQAGLYAEVLRDAVPVSDLAAAAPLGARVHAAVAPGFALLGDAAGALDPITGTGISHALLSAHLLADELARASALEDAVLHRFERRRQQLLRPAARLTRLLVALLRHPRLAARLLALGNRIPGLLSQLAEACAPVLPLQPPSVTSSQALSAPAATPDFR